MMNFTSEYKEQLKTFFNDIMSNVTQNNQKILVLDQGQHLVKTLQLLLMVQLLMIFQI